MADYKLMYYHLRGQMEMSAEILGNATDMLKSAIQSIEDLSQTHQQSIEELVAKNTKAVKDVSQIIKNSALRYDMLQTKIADAHKRTDELFAADDEIKKK